MRLLALVVGIFVFSFSISPAFSQSSPLDVSPVKATVGDPAFLDPTDGFKSTPYVAMRVEWNWETRPPLSVADFANDTALRARFTPDIDGTYVAVARLYAASDLTGTTVLHQVRVVAGTSNLPPVARIRGRMIAGDTGPFGLDATGSFDVDGDLLSYVWTIVSRPQGSTASILNDSAPLTTVAFDLEGFYTIGLQVQDSAGLLSPLATYEVKYLPVQGPQVAPVASAGVDQFVATSGSEVRLDAWRTTDLDGSRLNVDGYMTVLPAGAALAYSSEEGAVQVSLIGGSGDYLLSMQAGDWLWTSTDHVLVSVGPDASVRPMARILPVSGPVGAPLVLDGTQSHDLDGDLLGYRWSLLHRPAGSMAEIASSTRPEAGLLPDVAGLYVVQLQVDDDRQASVPVTYALQVGQPLPKADPGPDRPLVGGAAQQLDGTGSTNASPAGYRWSALDLTGAGTAAGLNDPTLATPLLTLPGQQGPFNEVIKSSPVYHFKQAASPGYCQFDTRTPPDMAGAPSSETLSITLTSRGVTWIGPQQNRVWEIENKKTFTRSVSLRNSAGTEFGIWVVPGKTSVHVTTPATGPVQMRAWVGTVQVAQTNAKTNPFNRNNPVCAGFSGQVVQLVVRDAGGTSLPATAYIGAANLPPVLTVPVRSLLAPAQPVTLSAASVATDPEGQPLTYGLNRPLFAGDLQPD